MGFGVLYAPTTVSASIVSVFGGLAWKLQLDPCHFDIGPAFVRPELPPEEEIKCPKDGATRLGNVVGHNSKVEQESLRFATSV